MFLHQFYVGIYTKKLKDEMDDNYNLINFVCPRRIEADVDDQETRARLLYE